VTTNEREPTRRVADLDGELDGSQRVALTARQTASVNGLEPTTLSSLPLHAAGSEKGQIMLLDPAAAMLVRDERYRRHQRVRVVAGRQRLAFAMC